VCVLWRQLLWRVALMPQVNSQPTPIRNKMIQGRSVLGTERARASSDCVGSRSDRGWDLPIRAGLPEMGAGSFGMRQMYPAMERPMRICAWAVTRISLIGFYHSGRASRA